MEFDLWSKTLLKSYGMIDRVTGSMDRTFERIVRSSRCANTFDTMFNSTQVISDKLLALIERKKVLVRTKRLVDELLEKMSKYTAKLLVLKYVNNLSNEEVARLLNKSVRTVLRHSAFAIEEFSKALAETGIKRLELYETYLDQRWVLDIYKRFVKEEEVYAKRTADYYGRDKK